MDMAPEAMNARHTSRNNAFFMFHSSLNVLITGLAAGNPDDGFPGKRGRRRTFF
jgi:hypothetical protein